MGGFERTGKSNVDSTAAGFERKPYQAPATPETLTALPGATAPLSREDAKAAGYTGNICDICFSTRMRVSGHCMVCEECGNTTGCS